MICFMIIIICVHGLGGKKVDIYRLGLLVLSLAIGEIVQDPTIPKGLPPDFTDFLRKCLHRDEHQRWASEELLEHRWLTKTTEVSPLKSLALKGLIADLVETGIDCFVLVGEARPDEEEAPLEEDDPDQVAVPFHSVGTGQSRLQSEFSFVCDIGKGGFGEVMKVKNNLDGQVYAIKKIKLNPKNKQSTKKLMREVKLLSRLNHENVVRYYTSWIEVTTIKEERQEIETSVTEDTTDSFVKPNPVMKGEKS